METHITDDQYDTGKVCPYCNAQTVYVDSIEVYGKSFGMIYLCRPCDTYVGVHRGTDVALGRLANRELRDWRKGAHNLLDKVWKDLRPQGIPKEVARKWAYSRLSLLMNIPIEKTHIGMFDVAQCRKVIELCRLEDNWHYDYIGPSLQAWASQYGKVIDMRELPVRDLKDIVADLNKEWKK